MTILLLLILLLFPATAWATVLGDAANALSPGQWVKMLDGTGAGQMGNLNATATYPAWDNSTSDNPGVNGSAAPGPAYDGGQPGWNSATRKMYFQTTEHGRASPGAPNWCPAYWPTYPHACWKPTWTYDTDTNHWDIGRSGSTITGVFPHDNSNNPQIGVHVWGGIAWDDGNQVLYVKAQETYNIQVFRFCAPTATASYCSGQLGDWKPLPNYSPSSGEVIGQALGYHRTFNGGTLLAFLPGGAGGTCAALVGYKEGTTGTNGTWSTVNDGAGCIFPNTGSTMLEGQYSTINQLMVLTAGGTKAWRVTNTGVVQPLDDAPCAIGTTNESFATAAEDVNTGDIYFLMCDHAPRIMRLRPAAASGLQWSTAVSQATLTSTGQLCAGDSECIWHIYATPIRTYGVIGFWNFKTYGTAEYWLFKPSATVGDTTPPTVSVTAPSGGATVSTAVTLSASASDDIGVVGVQFKVDGTNVGSEDTTSPYSISWDSTTVTNGTHSITAVARDAAGNGTTSSAVSVTVSNAGGGADFATRCKMPGVVKCVSFDSSSQIACTTWGCNSAIDVQYATTLPVIDTTIKASGTGSLKFTIDSQSPAAGGGSYWTNFSDDLQTQFGAGQTFYIQWRQRFSPEFINTIYTKTCLPSPACPGGNGNAGGWKQIGPTAGDIAGGVCPTIDDAQHEGWCQPQFNENKVIVAAYAACTPVDVVVQNTEQRKYAQMYNSCQPSASHGNAYWAVETQLGGGEISWQNARPSPFCRYGQQGQPNGGNFPPNGNCFGYFPNEWMTFKISVTIGPRGAPLAPCNGPTCGSITGQAPNNVWGNSRIRMWVGRENQPTELAIDQLFDLTAGNSGQQRIGKVYLLPYHSYKNEAQVHPTAYTWYDDLIISNNDIPDPSSGAAPHVFVPVSFKIQ